ncbi:hypothetical protein, partial [Microbispora sp. ATCC PTA-5024]|uniref:hypothetical protein n=1 Tax=Microbispora sp. ATCC PTA-5024 TaxID=316330 RepID=UPI001E454CA4
MQVKAGRVPVSTHRRPQISACSGMHLAGDQSRDLAASLPGLALVIQVAVVGEILERPTAELTSEEVAHFGRELPTATGFDRLWATLETAVKVVEGGDVPSGGVTPSW